MTPDPTEIDEVLRALDAYVDSRRIALATSTAEAHQHCERMATVDRGNLRITLRSVFGAGPRRSESQQIRAIVVTEAPDSDDGNRDGRPVDRRREPG